MHQHNYPYDNADWQTLTNKTKQKPSETASIAGWQAFKTHTHTHTHTHTYVKQHRMQVAVDIKKKQKNNAQSETASHAEFQN